MGQFILVLWVTTGPFKPFKYGHTNNREITLPYSTQISSMSKQYDMEKEGDITLHYTPHHPLSMLRV